MAQILKKIPMYIFIAINTLIVMAMIVCAYAQYLPPQRFPECSYLGMLFPLPLALDVVFVFFWLTFKRRLMVLPVAGMLLCAGAIRTFCPINLTSDAPAGCIKVLSYNVHSFGPADPDAWNENVCLQYLLDSDADIACLQECIVGRVEEACEILREKFPYQELLTEENNYLGIFSKHPILSSQRIEYQSSTNLSAAYEVLVGSDTVVVINNHFESYKLHEEDREQYKELILNPDNDSSATNYHSLVDKIKAATVIRGPQADSVAAFIEKNAGRYIIACGDFNDPSLSYTHHRMTKHLNDAYTRSGCGMGASYNRSGMYFRIDNILCSPNIKPCYAKVDDFINASDHYPIYALLKLKPKNSN